MESSSLCEKTR